VYEQGVGKELQRMLLANLNDRLKGNWVLRPRCDGCKLSHNLPLFQHHVLHTCFMDHLLLCGVLLADNEAEELSTR
jgi:hypothetical protein